MVSVISLGKVYTMGTVDLTLFAPQLLTGSLIRNTIAF
jgi:hypothetical protein